MPSYDFIFYCVVILPIKPQFRYMCHCQKNLPQGFVRLAVSWGHLNAYHFVPQEDICEAL